MINPLDDKIRILEDCDSLKQIVNTSKMVLSKDKGQVLYTTDFTSKLQYKQCGVVAK